MLSGHQAYHSCLDQTSWEVWDPSHSLESSGGQRAAAEFSFLKPYPSPSGQHRITDFSHSVTNSLSIFYLSLFCGAVWMAREKRRK